MEETKVSKLRMERLSRGWTIDEVAKHIGVSSGSIIAWEKNGIKPSVEYALRLADLYNVDIKELFSAH